MVVTLLRGAGPVFRALQLPLAALPLLAAAGCGPTTGGGTPAVPQWGRFEAELRHDRSYGDPFRDVSLDVTFTRPDGEQVRFWGFYDGDRTWRMRFMPDRPGVWRYEAALSDGTGRTGGTFTCVESDLPGMLTRDPDNPIWFGFSTGQPLLVRSFHVGDRFFAANWPAGERAAFLDWASAQGYNMLSIASHYLNRDEDGRGRGWQTPVLWNDEHRRPQPADYARMEAILDELAGRRMMAYPFAGFFGKSSAFPLDHADQELYIRYTLARLGASWNLLLNVAGPEPLQMPETLRRYHGAMEADDIRRLGTLIHDLNPFGHLVSIHNPPGDDPFREEPWAGYTTLQGAQHADWDAIQAYILRNHTGSRPVFAQEVFWPGNMHHRIDGRDLDPAEIRKKAFVLLFSGAAINFGDMDGNSSSGFSGSMDPSARHQPRHDIVKAAWDWFETIPFHRTRPRPELASHGFVLAEEGIFHAIYVPATESAVSLDLTGTEGGFTVRWYNPREGRYAGTRPLAGGAIVPLDPPSSGPDEDWIALVERLERP